MIKKSLLLGLMVVVLAFGMTVVGCEDDSSGDDNDGGVVVDVGEGWTNVTSFAQLDGRWTGSESKTDTQKGITIEQTVNMTFTFKASEKKVTIDTILWVSYSCSASDWDALKQNAPKTGKQEDGSSIFSVIPFEDTHTIFVTYNVETKTETLKDEDIADMLSSGMQINKNGTKVKVPADQISDSEIILYKSII